MVALLPQERQGIGSVGGDVYVDARLGRPEGLNGQPNIARIVLNQENP
jgi:hypothetical protein